VGSATSYGVHRHKAFTSVVVVCAGIFFGKTATFAAILGTRDISMCDEKRSVHGAGRIEVFGCDDLETRRRGEGLVDKNDGASRAGGVRDLWASVGDSGTDGNGCGGQHGKAVDTGRDVDVASVGAEGDASDEWRDGCEPLASGDKIDIDRTRTRGLIDEAESDLTGGCSLVLVGERELLQVCGGVTQQNSVLRGGGEGRFSRGQDLFASGGIGTNGVGAGGERDVGGDGAEVEIEGESVGALIDVQPRGVRSGVDNADLRLRRRADHSLAAGECECRSDREDCQSNRGAAEPGERGLSACATHVELQHQHTSTLIDSGIGSTVGIDCGNG
jgi:hypothetical protein